MATKMMDHLNANRFRAEFSLALNCRTGKYFMCKDIIESQALIDAEVRYWRWTAKNMPGGIFARLLGRLMTYEIDLRSRWPSARKLIRLMDSNERMLFTDPLQVIMYDLKKTDIVICHDLGPVTHPQYYAPRVKEIYESIFKTISVVRPHLVFVSNVAYREFVEKYGSCDQEAHIIPCPVRAGIIEGPETPFPNLEGKFIVSVGAVGTRKNQRGLIESYNMSGLSSRGVKLIIVGGKEPGFEQVKELAINSDGVILTGYVPDDQLRWLYSQACGLALPSYLEGFGMPAAEALLRRLIPLVSSGSALEEAAGPGAVSINPYDPISIACGLVHLVEMPTVERNQRIELGLKHVENFSEDSIRSKWADMLQIFNSAQQ